MTAPAPPRADLAELLALVDVSRARAASAEQTYLADVATLYGERELAVRSESEESDSLLTEALLLAVVALIRRGYRAGWEEGLRFAEQQFEVLRVSVSDLIVPIDSADDALVRDFLAGQSFVARSGGPLSELFRRAQLAVVSAVQMGRARATEAAFSSLTLSDTLHKMWVARFDLNSPPCAECVRLHGTYVPLGSEFEVPQGSPLPYGGVLSAPPRHPNCRCSLILYVPEWFDDDAESGPTPLSMRAYAEWVLSSSARDRADMIAATVVRVGSYTRMVRGKLQHVDGYFYHVESGKVVSPAQARALGAGEIRTVSVQQAKALRTQGKAPAGKAAGQATARRGGRAPGPGQQALDVGAPAKPVTAGQAPRPQPPAEAQGSARRRVARDNQKQWPQGEYEIKMPSGQNTKVTIHANGSSTATSGDRTEKANARQTKLFLDFWDGQGAVTQTKGDPTPEEKEESEKLGRDPDDPRPDPERDADRETEWQGDKPPEKAKPPEPEDDVAAKTEGVVQKGRSSLDPEKKPEAKKDEKKAAAKKPAEKPAAKDPEKKADAPAEDSGEPNSDIKEMSAQELAAEIAEVEDELRDMRRSGMSVEDDDYKDVRQRLQALNAEEDNRARPADAEPSGASPAAAEPVAKQAPQPVEKAKPAAKKPAEKAPEPEKPAEKAPEPEKPAPAKKAPAAKKPAATPKPEPVKVSDEDAARKPAAVPKVDKLDASSGRKMLQRAKASEKIVQVAGDDGSALASAMQLVTSTRHKHHVKVTDDSVRVSLKHIPVADDGSRQYLVHSNGVVFERGIGPDGEETLTQLPFQQVENLVGPKFSGESRPSLDDALKNVRKLTDDQLSDYMDEAIKADRIDDFERIANESDRRENQRARTAAQHEARAAEIERLLDEGFSVGEATEKVTGVSVDKQQRKMMINHLRAEGYTGVNLEELSRKAYKNYLYDLELAAEGPTIGYYLNKEGTTKGVDPSSMFYGSDEHRERYISDELRDFFEANEFPHSFESWQESYLQQAVDTDQLSRSGDGSEATKTERTSRVDDLPPAPEPTAAKPSQGRDEPAPAPEPVAAPDKPKVEAKKVASGKETKRAYADAVGQNIDAKRREREAVERAAETSEQRDDRELAAFDTALKDMKPGEPATAQVQAMRDKVATRVAARNATPPGKSPEDREDMKFARRSKDTGNAPLFMFESDDSLRDMQERNNAVLDSGHLKADGAERGHRVRLQRKIIDELKLRDRESKTREADEEARRRFQEEAAADPQPEVAPEEPIEDVRTRLAEARVAAEGDENLTRDLEIAREWATTYLGDPDAPPSMRGVKWDPGNQDKFDRTLLAGLAEARAQRELSEQFEAERKARKLAAETPPPPVQLERPAPIPEEHADLLDLDDRALSEEWGAIQQDMRDMRADGVKTTDEDYLENKARLSAIFAVMARRAQEGNREYIGGTPSRLEKLQELARAIQQAPPGERAALEAQLIRVFRGEE